MNRYIVIFLSLIFIGFDFKAEKIFETSASPIETLIRILQIITRTLRKNEEKKSQGPQPH